MSLPLDKLLQENKNRYGMCAAAIRVAQNLSGLPEEQWQEKRSDKIAVLSMTKILNGDARVQPIEDDDLLEGR